jgi:hypothetical protein
VSVVDDGGGPRCIPIIERWDPVLQRCVPDLRPPLPNNLQPALDAPADPQASTVAETLALLQGGTYPPTTVFPPFRGPGIGLTDADRRAALPAALVAPGCTVLTGDQADVRTDEPQSDHQQPQIFYHYGRHAKIAFILVNEIIPFSDESANPTRARHGSGVYVTDIAPGTLTKAQIAYQLYGSPHRGNQAHVEAWVAIDTRGMDVIFTGKSHIYRIPTFVVLPVAGRIIGSGVTP